MPVNFTQIRTQVKQWGEKAPLLEQDRTERLDRAFYRLGALAEQGPELRERIQTAAALNSALRCACPADLYGAPEPLTAAVPEPPKPAGPLALLAADGSQINPDRHAPVEFCVINVGAVEMRLGESFVPREDVQSLLLVGDELMTPTGKVTQEIVELRRDLKEREYLARYAETCALPLITLTDGPLELYRERQAQATPEFEELFQRYLVVLEQLAERHVTTAGYVDKPGSDLVLRMLDVSQVPESELQHAQRQRTYRGLTDRSLFRRLLEPGQRSAVFQIQSSSAMHFQGGLALHFFYLNVGRPGAPYITRVEVPAWVARDRGLLDPLHAVLLSQCRALGARPYPYVLHRAHEVAVVTLAEKAELEQMIQSELLRRGVAPGEKSNKQSHKDLAGRTRHLG